MADFNISLRKCLRWEGGYTDTLDDGYECTNSGITIATYQKVYGDDKDCSDLKKMTAQQRDYIYKTLYWDKIKGDELNCQPIADLLYNWAVGSGVKSAVKHIQRLVGVADDGIMGNITLSAVNDYKDPHRLFDMLWEDRYQFFQNLCRRNPQRTKFLRGWINRLKSHTWYE